MTTKDKKSGTSIQRLVFGALVPSVMAASAQEREQLVSHTRESLALKDEKYKDSPMDIVFPTKKSYFSEKDLEAEALEGPSKRGGSAAKAAPKKHLRDPNKMESKDELEDPGVLQAYQVSGPASGLSNGSGASFEDDNTLYFVIDRVKKAQPVSVDLVQKNTPANGGKTSRRAIKRVPAAEGEHVEVRTRKAKAQNEQDPPGIVLGGNGVVWIDGSGKCVQGTSSFVKFTCDNLNLGCCDEDDSCDWPSAQTATVCEDSCMGEKACQDVGDGAVIEKDSCQGEKACYDLAKVSTTGKIRVGKASCIGETACRNICDASEDCELTIGDDACIIRGVLKNEFDTACGFMGSTEYNFEDRNPPANTQIKIISVDDGACDGKSACPFVASSGGKSITIGKKACVGTDACLDLAYYSTSVDVYIGDYSCDGPDACFDTFAYAKSVRIGTRSCYGSNACEYICYYSEKCEVAIGDDACRGNNACKDLGYNDDGYVVGKIEVKDGACDGDDACLEFGTYSTSIKIGKKACQGADACEKFGFEATKKVEAGDYSCDGSAACEEFALNIDDEDVKVDKNECIGDMECSSDACKNTAKVPNNDGLCPAP